MNAIEGLKGGTVWTLSMGRMMWLVDKCVRHREPVLLIGEGCRKTTIVQVLAEYYGHQPLTLNGNQHVETADFISKVVRSAGSRRLPRSFTLCSKTLRRRRIGRGGCAPRGRPCEGRGDGPLVVLIRSGAFFLVSEINTAEDAVLERLNGVLEPG